MPTISLLISRLRAVAGLLGLALLLWGLTPRMLAPAHALQTTPASVSDGPAAPVSWTNLLPNGSLDATGADGALPLGWHRTFGSANQGPLWDHGVGHAGGASLSILDYLPDGAACFPIPNSPNPCEMWYSDEVPMTAGSPYRLHFWALAPQPARATVGLLIKTATGTRVVSVDFEDTSSSPAWADRELVLTPDVLQSYGDAQSARVFVRAAAQDGAVHQIWVDDLEFGPSAASSSPAEGLAW
jgi:hypothetical protein